MPAQASEEELAAARLLSETLAKASGKACFPVQRESRWRFWQRGIFVGETQRARQELSLPGKTKLERAVGCHVSAKGVVLRSRWREDIGIAASWWLEKHAAARWFIPGPLGESVPQREDLIVAHGSEFFSPSFISRNVSGIGTSEGQAWYAVNRLRALFTHHHSMSAIYQPEDFARMPELAPLINGGKFVPKADTHNWQPNLVAKAAATHAAAVLRKRFREEPGLLSASVAMNDTLRYDQSAATLAAVGPPRYFRHQPDYSNLVFGYTNQVARELAQEFPDRFITAYAYYWTENVPEFPVEPNVIPYLTADRSQWFDPAYAAEDRELIRRWVAAGPKIVGIYDYYYGAPFVVPRPTLYAVTQGIPFAYEAGVRAFYAEIYPNWGLDGPKAWLAAQLLWDARQDPARLLDTYYHEYWQEAEEPMRKFFELCDRQWLNQPRPAYWLKYYNNEQQGRLFPSTVRRELREQLTRAESLARTEKVRARVQFTSAAFATTEAYVGFDEARDALSRLTMAAKPDADAVLAASQATRQARQQWEECMTRIKETHPLALSVSLRKEYQRHDPRRRALWRLLAVGRADEGREQFRAAFGDLVAGRLPVVAEGRELLIDGALARLVLRDEKTSTALEWVQSGAWRGHGEPYETRDIMLDVVRMEGEEAKAREQGQEKENDLRVLRFAGCKQETLSQWRPGKAGAWYVGTAQVRGKISPGNLTFLIISFLDAKGQHIGIGSIDGLPVGDWPKPVEMAVFLQAPAEAVQVGFGLRVLNQVNDDYVEFSRLSLKEMKAE